MRQLRVLVDPSARTQMAQIVRWWRDHRGSPDLVKRELHQALAVLARTPNAGAIAAPALHRFLLRRAQYYIYYRVDHAAGVVHIVAIWHTSRGSGPPL